jgi:hypothetical protein
MHLKESYLTFNAFTYKKPTLALRILEHLDFTFDPISLFPHLTPFAVFMDEFKNIANSIMDENNDLLGIFKSEDPDIREFAEKYKIRKE